jgi:3-hydroxybutyryl-CoA dehydrogenase
MEIREVGVLGCGLMGSGIAQVAAASGYPVIVLEATQEFYDKGYGNIVKRLERQVQKGTIDAKAKEAIQGRLRGTTDVKDLKNCDIIIEAIIEKIEEKNRMWRAIDAIAKKDAILASNTSSVPIVDMMIATTRPERFLGIHFMNPVPVMELVEVIRSVATSSEVFETSIEWVKKLGKQPVRTEDRPGFIVNRLLVPYLLDAIRGLEEGIGSVEDIDKSMRLGCGHPMGPFTLLDFVGLDTTYYIANILFDEFKEARFAPPGLLKRMVVAGWHGRKTGKGFYDYADPNSPKVMEFLKR